MFTRADELWLDDVEGRLPYHVLGYGWDGFSPQLDCLDTRTGRLVPDMVLEPVDLVVGRVRKCVGRFEGDVHIGCPDDATVTRFVQCASCAGESFIPHQECIFEPKCDGELCDVEFCRRQHVLYLAFYGGHAKIGMSSTRRVERRLIEQGADAYAIIGTYPTRRRAREAEKEISAKLRIPQSYRQVQLLKDLTRPVDAEAIEEQMARLGASLADRFGLEPERVSWLDSYPIDLPLETPPKLVETHGIHRGERIGIKGRWLVFESNGLKALDLSDLPSRFVGARSDIG